MKKNVTSHSNLVIDSRRIIGEDTPFAIREAYRSLYTNVMYLPIESRCRKIVLTSAYPGEGKTSVSINLAYTIAATSPEAKILLVDADMRSPRVAQLLDIDTRGVHGLSEFLAGIDDTPNVMPTVHPNLMLLASGAENANTPALLSSSKMALLTEYCNNNYDYVIFDTPPVNIVTDAVFLSDHVDGYILVARADYSDINSLNDAVNTLTRVEGKIFGVVLCSLDTKRAKRYGGYGKYGKYGRYARYSGSKYTR